MRKERWGKGLVFGITVMVISMSFFSLVLDQVLYEANPKGFADVTKSMDSDGFLNALASTGGFLQLKWTVNIGGGTPQPVMGDIDNDGEQEIVIAGGNRLRSVNGKSGAIEWDAEGGAWGCAPELADLDNDGIPEVLTIIAGPKLRALNGDGSIRWTSTQLEGTSASLIPIVAYDIDGDGYPTIYVSTNGYTAECVPALHMIDHMGNILATSSVYKPCWGGTALGDVNFDGIFEVYMGDRASYGGPGALGLRCWNAHTLERLWERPDLYHSSPSPLIADVVEGGNLELIGHHIINNGCVVVDGMTGETLPGMDYKGYNIPTHAKGTAYDIDCDGNMEFIASASRDNLPKDFVVFDLVDGTYDFRPTFDFWIAWPPTVGDVTGDGYMEILAGTGNEYDGGNYPLLIYDRNFDLVQTVETSSYLFLSGPRVFDCDSDGFNEVIVGDKAGTIWCYDTPAPTPDPAPRTWCQFYSEYRTGAAEYVEPPGPKAPVIKNENPVNNADDISLNPLLSVELYDFQRDRFDVTFEINGGSSWQTIKTYASHSVTSFTAFTANTNGYVNEYDTEYDWRVTVVDSKGNTDQKSFSFTTESGSGPVNHPPYTPNNPDPYNGETGVDVNHNLDWAGGDQDGDTVYYDVYFGTDSTPDSGEFKTATTSSSYDPGMLNEGTTYYWRIVAFDEHGEPANPQGSTWHFTTESVPVDQPPVANFVYSPTNPGVLDEIYFTDTSFDSDGYIDSWYWEFDDEDTSTLQNPIHQYTGDGTYLVNLMVTDDNGGIDTMEKTITVSTSTAEMLDQKQTAYTYDFVAYGSRWGAQSFKPTLDTLTRVELFVGKTGSPDNMIVSIRDNPYGNDLTSVSVPAGNIPASSGWVSFDFPDLSVTPGSTYYIIARTGGSSYSQCYKIGFTLGNPYVFGSLWYSGNAGSNWLEYAMYDFCFKTHGLSGTSQIPVLSYAPNSHDFGNMLEEVTDSITFDIWNSGTGTLAYSLSESCDWVEISSTGGTSGGEHNTVNVNINTIGLSTGSYQCDIGITSNGGSGVFTVYVTVTSPSPILSYAPNSHDFGSMLEKATDHVTFDIWNSGTGSLMYSLNDPDCTWVGVVPASGYSTGESDTITVNINTIGLSTGSYQCDIGITSNGGSGVFTVYVNVVAGGTEGLDQKQTAYTYDFVAYGSRWGAQSFKPTLDTLTRVELFVGKTGSPDSMIVSIRDNPYGNDLTSVSVPAGNIPASSGWVSFDFPDLSVTPGSTYYIIARTGGSGYHQYYKIGFTLGDPYALGSLWYSGNAGSNWLEYTMYDFCFKTYGI